MNNSRFLIVVGAAFCLVAGACQRTDSLEDQAALCQEISVSSGSISRTISANGKVEPAATVLVGPRVGGRVVDILVREGDHVEAGQPLVKIERNTQFVQYLTKIKHELNKAKLKRESTATELERARELVNAGLRPRTDVEKLETTLSAFELEERVTQDKWKEMERTVGERISPEFNESDLAAVINTRLISPIAGTVKEIMVRRGENVSPGRPGSLGQKSGAVLAIADVSDCLMMARVSELDINHLANGQSVELRFDSIPGKVFPGRIRRIESFSTDRSASISGPFLNTQGLGRFDVEIEVENIDPVIRPGISFEAVFLIEERKNVVVVPIEAILESEESSFILIKEGQPISRRRIFTGLSNTASVEITSGLKVGDIICRHPRAYLESVEVIKEGK